MNLSVKETQTQRHREQTCSCQKGRRWGRMEWEVSGYKLFYTERINNKVLLYSTENYIQYPMINHRGKEYQKKNVYIYVCVMNHFAIQQKLTQRCKSAILQKKKVCMIGGYSFYFSIQSHHSNSQSFIWCMVSKSYLCKFTSCHLFAPTPHSIPATPFSLLVSE